MPTLTVAVGGRSNLDERTRRRIKTAREGDELEDAEPVLQFSSDAELNRLLAPTNVELLETIAEHDPESISAAAELVDRDYKQVHRNLTELADIGVIEFDDAEPGQPKRPLLAYDGLEIDIPFTPSDGDGSAVAP